MELEVEFYLHRRGRRIWKWGSGSGSTKAVEMLPQHRLANRTTFKLVVLIGLCRSRNKAYSDTDDTDGRVSRDGTLVGYSFSKRYKKVSPHRKSHNLLYNLLREKNKPPQEMVNKRGVPIGPTWLIRTLVALCQMCAEL